MTRHATIDARRGAGSLQSRWSPTLVLFLLLCLAAVPGHAGPPLLCHPFEIGDATSLPWARESDWRAVSPSYELQHLQQDVLSILSDDAPVLVRMETLRRAAVYVGSDPAHAHRLLEALRERLAPSGTDSSPLAWFDAGYFVETYKQSGFLHREQALLLRGDVRAAKSAFAEIDGYAWILEALRLAPEHAPTIELAAALASRGSANRRHLASAYRSADSDPLLRRNLERHFPPLSRR